jgi:GDP/UDP-N,N'-diacetylbacillosamine 2-epimerase (hydrolysing)
MGGYWMKIAILTSSRADYGIYYPLLNTLQNDKFFNTELIVFGTHLSEKFGRTIKSIIHDGFKIGHKINTCPESDSPDSINSSIGKTISAFSKIWKESKYDLVFALGDRYEMFSAVTSSLPFNITIAHIHGGETTLGAIDNAYRNSITHMSKFHFTCCESYKQRVTELTGSSKNVFNVGALSIENIKKLKLLSKKEFFKNFKIDLERPTILVTFHPETIDFKKNEEYIKTLIKVLLSLNHYQIVITMPNADTMGLIIRKHLVNYLSKNKNAIGVESFGSLGYLSCMKHCKFLLGNTSSGFVEASYLLKPVINIGRRQDGRIITPNIVNCEISYKAILNAINEVENGMSLSKKIKIYGDGNTSKKIIEVIKKIKN